jgi:alpha-mannosidase
MAPIHTLYLIHHSHTDIGYTSDQPVVWDLHTRFIDEALDLAERDADHDSDGAFRWTVETTAILQHWLEHASSSEIDRLIALEKAGRVEVTGMFLNITPLYDADQTIESLQMVGRLRKEYGFDIRAAMNCDVNGQNWSLVDLLLDAGIEGFSMAINTHFGGALRPRPLPFLWQGPSGRTLPTYNGWTYDKGWTFGIGRSIEEFGDTWWPRAQSYLDEIGFPLPILMLQSYHPFGDNGSAFDFTPFIDAWNASGRAPHIMMATPRTWWQALQGYNDRLPTLAGDWTDYWNFGSVSSAREQAINRQSRARLRTADGLHAMTHTLVQAGGATGKRLWSKRSYDRHRTDAWHALHLWDEHTWGADIAVRMPNSDDTASQWNHKAHYAYSARSLSLLLQRDGIGDLARYIPRADRDDLLIFNPLPWPRTIAGVIRPEQAVQRGQDDDGTAGRHHLDRQYQQRWHPEAVAKIVEAGYAPLVLRSTEIPAFGYAVLQRADLHLPGAGAIAGQNLSPSKVGRIIGGGGRGGDHRESSLPAHVQSCSGRRDVAVRQAVRLRVGRSNSRHPAARLCSRRGGR